MFIPCVNAQKHPQTCDPGDREVRGLVKNATDCQYAIGKIPELCELCTAIGERNAAVKFSMSRKIQICRYCINSETCDPFEREIGRISAEDAADSNYAIGKIPEICELCIAVGKQRTGVKYCMSCKKRKCTFCVDSHQRFEVLMDHVIVDTKPLEGNYQHRYTKCQQHEENDLDRFCINHNLFCCVVCTDEHSGCVLTTNIRAIESGSRTSLALVKSSCKKIESYMEEMRTKNVESGTNFRTKVEILKRQFEKRKQNVENMLRRLQRKSTPDLSNYCLLQKM